MARRLGAGLVLVAVAGLMTACGGGKTTPFAIRFKNDLSRSVHLYQCVGPLDKCLQTTQGVRLLVGQTALAPARQNLPNAWLVQPDGQGKVSCISPTFTQVPTTPPLILLSSATPGVCGQQ